MAQITARDIVGAPKGSAKGMFGPAKPIGIKGRRAGKRKKGHVNKGLHLY